MDLKAEFFEGYKQWPWHEELEIKSNALLQIAEEDFKSTKEIKEFVEETLYNCQQLYEGKI
jgi:hypothetical protein